MSFCEIVLPEYVISGTRARLIPVIADSSKEGRLCSAFLAASMVVKDYASELLSSIDVKVGKTSKIVSYTEVVLKNNSESKIRPDGLLVITTGNKEWRALIEAKVGNAELDKEQIEHYLDLARELKIDAVITISNQFTASPKHHPLIINGNKTRSVGLYHWSWAYLMSEAVMWVKYNEVKDPEQAYILEELVRYLEHDSSGVTSIERVNSEWKDVCSAVQTRVPLNKNSDMVRLTTGTWHQLIRSTSLKLGVAIGRNVVVSMPKAHRDDAEARLKDDSEKLANDQLLECLFEIPDTVSRLRLAADFETKSISCSMRINAPVDKATSKGRISWITSQLKKSTISDVIVKAIWAGRATDTYATLAQLRSDDLKTILSEDRKDSNPIAFEVVLSKDLGSKFSGQKTIVDEIEPLIVNFYREVGQNLRDWNPSPPKVKTQEELKIIPDELEITTDSIGHFQDADVLLKQEA